MPLNTFNPPVRPSMGTGIAPEVTLRKAQFGDGYTQNSPAGLNHIRQVVTLKWETMSLAEARQIETFLIGQGGYIPFYYTLNGESTPRKWTCESWALTDGHPSKIQATFRENFTTAT
ncbi:phage tail protein [Paracoccus litorisediminis]|uniref:Phage tail protein n=1 Tax=Paracoccus litorisediminis TaxID=2006130 RepID=A0A844HMW0_9RHOB|nr:phage tail protein [Paracoccus litorisediminis]MTH61206.1 phage tail protein [Paracoccus litorisediminis]